MGLSGTSPGRVEQAWARPKLEPISARSRQLERGLLPSLRRQAAVEFTVIAAVLFNVVLAVVNANVASLNSGIVIACEGAITASALVLGVDGRYSLKTKWIWLCVLIVAFGVSDGFGSGNFDPKFVRDVLLIPVFILLGLSSRDGALLRITMWLQWIVLSVALFEAIRPEQFGRFFNVMSYYIKTRGFQQESFWNGKSDLFVSATRPGARFLFSSLNIHRLSSVFLEPVSLGNYCVLVVIIAATLWASLTFYQKSFLCLSTAMLLIGCDGRFATVTIIIIVLIRFIAPSLPRFSNWLYLPGVLGAAGLAVVFLHLSPHGDDFPSRTAGSIMTLSQIDFEGVLGFRGPFAYRVMDSGIAYLVYSQSLAGALVIWSFIALGMPQRAQTARFVLHAASLYFTLNLLISYSVFSIKTAALLWFAYGYVARHSGFFSSRESRHIGEALPVARRPAWAASEAIQ